MEDIPLRCKCGVVRGVLRHVDAKVGMHVVCYCDDCQAFAKFLDRPDVLDAAGGTEIFQMPPAYVSFVEGVQQLRCMRLSDKGLYRWYTDCCRTPIGNTVSAKLPVVGLIHSCIALDVSKRDEVLGKPAGVMAKFATGAVPPWASQKMPPTMPLRIASRLASWYLRGLGKPTPFFEPSGAPRVTPRVLTREERRALR